MILAVIDGRIVEVKDSWKDDGIDAIIEVTSNPKVTDWVMIESIEHGQMDPYCTVDITRRMKHKQKVIPQNNDPHDDVVICPDDR